MSDLDHVLSDDPWAVESLEEKSSFLSRKSEEKIASNASNAFWRNFYFFLLQAAKLF